MTATPPDISVVICAYTEERWNLLCSALESLRRQSLLPREIVVAVDHNQPLLERVLYATTDVLVVPNVGPRGLSGARNSGLAAASSAVVAFLDEDAVAAPNWIERLAAGYCSPRVLGVGGAILPRWAGGRPGWFPEEFDWVVGCTYRGMPAMPRPVRNLIGCNMSFRRHVFAAIGGFRDGIGRVGARPVGCEETELCIRLRQRWPDAALLYDPSARVYHYVPPERARWRYFHARCYGEGISKAAVARLVGGRDGLASERSYVLRTLPAGLACGIRRAIDDPAALARAGVIAAGLAITAAGYLAGTASELLAATGVGQPGWRGNAR